MPKKPFRKSSGRMASKGHPNPIDIWVGSKIREARTLAGQSQTDLGDALGLTFQQVQKYEKGANRLSCSRLYDAARALGVPIMFFFDDMPGDVEQQSPGRLAGGLPAKVSSEGWSTSAPSLRTAREIEAIEDAAVKTELLKLARTLGRALGAGPAPRNSRGKVGTRIRA